MKCSKCGNDLPPDAKFCENCGSAQSVTPEQSQIEKQETFSENPEDVYKQALLKAYANGALNVQSRMELLKLQRSLGIDFTKTYELEKWVKAQIAASGGSGNVQSSKNSGIEVPSDTLLNAQSDGEDEDNSKDNAFSQETEEEDEFEESDDSEEEEELEESDDSEEEEEDINDLWDASDRKLRDVMTVFRTIHDSHIFIAPDLNDTKIEKAMKSYAQDVELAAVLLHVDDTLFGGAKEGLIVTQDAVYSKELGSSPITIKITKDTTFSLQKKTLMVDGEKVFTFSMPEVPAMEKVVKGLQLLVEKK